MPKNARSQWWSASCSRRRPSPCRAQRQGSGADDSAHRDTDACVLLDESQLDILRLEAQRLVERADKLGPDDGQPLFEKAGGAYVDTYRQYCDEPARSGRTSHIAPATCDEIAYNSARAFVAARRTVKAVVVYGMLVADAKSTKRASPLASRAMYQLGASYQSMALYAEAADWYERFATLHPREPQSAGSAVIGGPGRAAGTVAMRRNSRDGDEPRAEGSVLRAHDDIHLRTSPAASLDCGDFGEIAVLFAQFAQSTAPGGWLRQAHAGVDPHGPRWYGLGRWRGTTRSDARSRR